MRAFLIAILFSVNLLVADVASADDGQALTGQAECPVSVPNGDVGPGFDPDDYFADEANVTTTDFYGNGSIFTLVPDEGTFQALRDAQGEGGWNKFIFYRLPVGVDLVVVILPFGWEHHGDPARADPSPGQEQFVYQVFGVWFPSDGCWEIRAHSRGTVLSIVVDVVFVDSWTPAPGAPLRVQPLP